MSNDMSERAFKMADAVRASVPLLVGLSSPSGGGKTYSALRLATGMQQVVGGEIAMIDTEARRGLHYADLFSYKHVPFDAPFGSRDYLRAIEYCHSQGAKIIIVDSMTHEHDGPGGLLESHGEELTRIAGATDWQKREAMNFLAWQKPKAARRALITGLTQMQGNFILCFRAKKMVKPVKKDGKTTFEQQGFMPIAGDEFPFECIVNIVLPPASGGVPEWQSEYTGERTMMKLPMQFEEIFAKPRPLDENIGIELAEWARGGERPKEMPKEKSAPAQPNAATDELCEAIQDEFRKNGLSGTSAEERSERNAILRDFFGTHVWSKIQAMSVAELEAGLGKMQEHFHSDGS